MQIEKIARPITTRHAEAGIDIIIPYHGLYDHVVRLLESMFKYTPGENCRVCLVDDGSTNLSFGEKMKAVPDVTYIRSESQHGFGAAFQAGLAATTNPWIVGIQSDCVVEDVQWLKGMKKTLTDLKPAGVRMVAARTNNPVVGDPALRGQKGETIEDVVLEKTHLSLHCFMCHRELFERVGGSFQSYPFCGYEDEEFAHRMRGHGFRQAISGQSWVHHVGELTTKMVCRRDQDARKEIEKNRGRCIADLRSLYASKNQRGISR
jgi:GT2 family glycosyltransferase